MSIFKSKRKKIYFSSDVLKQARDYYGEKLSAEQLMEFLTEISDDYVLIRYEKDELSMMNRINYLWVTPLYLIVIAPIKWVITGDMGMREDSSLKRAMKKLLGDQI